MPALPSSPRLEFCWWTEDHLPLPASLWRDPEVMKYLGGVMSPVEVEERLKLEIERARLINVQYWPIFERSTGAFASCSGLRAYHHEAGVFEVGVHIMRHFWSEGLGEEAARAVIRFALDELKVNGLTAGHNPENVHSKDLLGRLGFAFSHIEPWGPLQSGHLFYRLQPGDLKPRLDDLSVA